MTELCGKSNMHSQHEWTITRDTSNKKQLTGGDVVGFGGSGDNRRLLFPGSILLLGEKGCAQSSQLVKRDDGDGGRRHGATEGRGGDGVHGTGGNRGQIE